jgi:N-methylhydantoinase B
VSVDSVTLAVVRGAFEELVREMDDTMVSSAFSPIISEGRDCAHAVFEANSDLIVQGELSLPVFVGSLTAVCRHVVTSGRVLRPGDIVLYNHPDVGGTHVQDMKLMTPFYVDGELVFYLGSTGHWLDVGGSIPGGWHPESRSVFAEGILIDGIRLVKEGVLDEEVLHLFLTNARIPLLLEGDISAHLSALEVGARRLEELVARYGVDQLLAVVAEMKERSEHAARARIRELENRTVSFADIMDNDGLSDRPIDIVCDLTIRDDTLVLDFTRSADQSPGPINIPEPGTTSACMVALKHWWPDIPINAGVFRPVEIVTRPGSVLSARAPAPVAGFSEVMQRVTDVVLACLGQLSPQDAMGCSFGTTSGISISTGTALGAWYLDGGYGGSAVGDGLQGATPTNSMAQLPPVEVFEHRLPVRFIRRGVRLDSGGDGTHRGGCGTTHELEFTADCALAFLGDRARRGPFGVNGGDAGAPAHWSFRIQGRDWAPPMGAKGSVQLQSGDRLAVDSPGGGGWGPAAERDPERRRQDHEEGYVTGGGE